LSTNATSADSATSLSVPTDVLTDAFVPSQPPATRRQAQLRRQLLSADVISGSVTGALAALAAGLAWNAVPVVALAVGLGWPVLAYICGLYAADDLRTWASGVGEAPRLAVTALLVSWPVFALLSALTAPRPVLGALVAGTVTGAGAGLGRAAARIGLHRVDGLRQRALILGSGTVAKQLVDRLQRHSEIGLDPVGFIDDDVHQPGELGIPRLGTLDSLADLITFGRVDRVMIAFSRASHEDLLHCVRICRDKGVTVDIVPRLFEFLDGARSIELVGGMPLLSIQQPSLTSMSRTCKRALDIVGASIVLTLLAPLLAAVAVAVKLNSKGPVLFTQSRAGRGGRFFKLYKFRSMKTDATVLVRDDGAIVKRPNDDRITAVGRWIRRFSIDEAPQLINVLKGDMSLVGPRPLVLAEHAALSEDWQNRRADLRPGLTGPWQISGRSHIPFQEMIKFDYQYVAGWSLARDLEILLATLPAVVSGRGAY
jgi:exopolysaccharide biosynthesis polyprenyl glycosylphosphotransferase